MKKRFRFFIRLALAGFLLLNIVAAFHGYRFTHFSTEKTAKTQADKLSALQKASVLFFGIQNPRPENIRQPQDSFEKVLFTNQNITLEGWYLSQDSAIGEVILFHGYSGEKSAMLSRAKLLQEIGYNTLLVDFRGSGGSTGTQTTIGYKEASDVVTAVTFLQQRSAKPMYLLGTSMGAVAIMKAVAEHDLAVSGIILECPFGSLLQTAKNRFENMGLPGFPFAHLLVFWGGVENGFWGFSHTPTEYSKDISIPTLLIYGEKDGRVKQSEIGQIYQNLSGKKKLLAFPEAGHGNYLEVDAGSWKREIEAFMSLSLGTGLSTSLSTRWGSKRASHVSLF